MKNSEKPAYPTKYKTKKSLGGDVATSTDHVELGLTKREKFAMAAMQGLCAWDGAWNDETRRAHAKNAVSMADALLKELGENND